MMCFETDLISDKSDKFNKFDQFERDRLDYSQGREFNWKKNFQNSYHFKPHYTSKGAGEQDVPKAPTTQGSDPSKKSQNYRTNGNYWHGRNTQHSSWTTCTTGPSHERSNYRGKKHLYNYNKKNEYNSFSNSSMPSKPTKHSKTQMNTHPLALQQKQPGRASQTTPHGYTMRPNKDAQHIPAPSRINHLAISPMTLVLVQDFTVAKQP